MSVLQTTEPVNLRTPVPTAVELAARRVDQRLRRLLDDERTRWAGVDVDLAAPLDALTCSVLAGGKRLRPTFCALGFQAAGGRDDVEPGASLLDDAGAAFEMLHAFALVHDDVMDGADTRRGLATPHASFRDDHRQVGGRGESRRFGESVAILVGDLAHVYAERLAARFTGPAREVWHEMQTELMMGQYLDVLRTSHGRADRAQARRIAELKSGRYTIERPLELGAALASAPPDSQHHLRSYAAPLGLAFQLRDDVLGAIGDPGLTGKPVGGDLREGKPTPLLAVALERASNRQRALLDRAGAPSLTDDELRAMQQVLIDTGALSEVEGEISALTGQAVGAVDEAGFAEPVAESLVALAWFVSQREA
jgi:geranylgeranyl diphosphate synthase, type I